MATAGKRALGLTAPTRDLPRAIILTPTDGCLPLARSLHQRGVPVHVLTTGRSAVRSLGFVWVARSRWAEESVVGGLPRNRDAWLERLSKLSTLGPGVLIPGTDGGSVFLVHERSRIPENLRSFESPESAHLQLMDKRALYDLADRAGVRHPWTLHVSGLSELGEKSAAASYPCVVKPVLSHEWRKFFGDHRVFLLHSAEELRRVASPALEAGVELLISEHVPGPDSNIEGALTVRRSDGSLALAYGRRKLRQYPPGFGVGSLFESVELPETMALALRLLEAAGFAGVSMVETKRHAKTGEVVLIEVNVRVPQSFGLGDASGVDASWRLYATLAGHRLPAQPTQRMGVKTVVPSVEPLAVLTNRRQGKLTLRDAVASYRGVRDLSGLSPRDPVPALTLALQQLVMLLRLARGRLRSWFKGVTRT